MQGVLTSQQLLDLEDGVGLELPLLLLAGVVKGVQSLPCLLETGSSCWGDHLASDYPAVEWS